MSYDETVPSDLPALHDVPAPSASAHLLDELIRFAHRPMGDDADPRPLPEPDMAEMALGSMVESLSSLLTGTRLEDDLPDLLWSLVNVLHRKADRVSRTLDDNAVAQRRSQGEQDGSEVRSVELERLTAEGLTQEERRNAFEFLRDHAAELYAAEIGSAWRPRAGSMVNHRAMTAAVSDSRDYLNAKRVSETALLLPKGPRIAFTGGHACNDVPLIWDVLDKIRTKHAGMVRANGRFVPTPSLEACVLSRFRALTISRTGSG